MLEVTLGCRFRDGQDLAVAAQLLAQRQLELVEQIGIRMSTDAGKESTLLQLAGKRSTLLAGKRSTLMENLVLVDLEAHGEVECLGGADFAGTDFLKRVSADLLEVVEKKTFDPESLAYEDGSEFELFGDRAGPTRRRVDERVHVDVVAGKLLHLVALLGPSPLGSRGTAAVAAARGRLAAKSFSQHLDHDHDDDESDNANVHRRQINSGISGLVATKLEVGALSLCQHCKDRWVTFTRRMK